MAAISLAASPREILGKKVKNLRKQGIVPANLFGHNVPSSPLQVDAKQAISALRVAGTHALINLEVDNQPPKTVLVRSFATDPRTGHLLHLDLYEVGMKEKLRVKVPLEFVGEAPAVAGGGILIRAATELEVESLPRDLPAAITVDLSPLTELDSSIHVRDLKAPPDVEIVTDADEVVARVATPRVEKEEEAAPEAAPAEAREEKPAPPEGEAGA